MKGIIGGVLGLALLLAFLLPAPAANAASEREAERGLFREKDCADFANQASAQDYFEANGGSSSNNVDGLDADGDGVACESNPCPCASDAGGSGGGGSSGGTGGGPKTGARVVSVTDGDTVKVTVHGKEEDVRIIGIDTPEVFFGEECGGAEASASMKKLLQPGDRVRLIRDRSQDNRDAYDRLLRYVEQGGRDVGRKQVHRGWAQVYVFETPFERVSSYRRQRNKARQADRGAWRLCDGNFHQPL